jgi:hypothetical protein
MLQDPAVRAYSHFIDNRKRGKENKSYWNAIENERPLGWHPELFARYSYIARGLYFELINQWLKYFDVEQFLFIQSEEFFEKPQAVLIESMIF